jgi:hypothetical protein
MHLGILLLALFLKKIFCPAYIAKDFFLNKSNFSTIFNLSECDLPWLCFFDPDFSITSAHSGAREVRTVHTRGSRCGKTAMIRLKKY